MEFKIKASMERKLVIENQTCSIEKVIELDQKTFDKFMKNNLSDQDFIRENREHMHWRDGEYHCVLAIGEGRQDGVLISAEGYDYARYSAFIPNARDIVQAQTMPSDLKSIIKKVQDLYDFTENKILEKASELTVDSTYEERELFLSDEDLPNQFDMPLSYDLSIAEIVCEMLKENNLVSDINYDEGFMIEVSPSAIERMNQENGYEQGMNL